ncbi:uncharacterized protein BX664DRAFT_78568 [Halteromyces radiatus]|uniref:uncharacterized protein n=1 Tax=Halteromyces radiatus TaxID=101107 RepID=UPI0022202E96|nr:uncharacterized protein BX664DRAFT_78568 [Halteromyces radiatus]KAI8097355.1 hypothetical protein BX664DRAFT_78568 [Halteromyces radiatus]
MSQWKEGDGDYIPVHAMENATLLTKNNVPHTPTPTLTLYELSNQNHNYVNPTTSWNFHDTSRRKHNNYSTTLTSSTSEFETRSTNYSKQHEWSRNDKTDDKKYSQHHSPPSSSSSSSSSSSTSSLFHPLTHGYMDLHTDGSPVRTMPSQVIPPVILPANHHQDHRVVSQGMVTLDNNHNPKQPQLQQFNNHSEHSHYSTLRDSHHSTKSSYSRSFPDTSHSLLSYHHHSSQQNHRHSSISTAEQAAVHAAAAAAVYQSHSVNSSQMTWYAQHSTFQKSSQNDYHHSINPSSRPSKHELCQDSNSEPPEGSNFVPMNSSRMEGIEYHISPSTTTTTGNFMDQHRQANQWTSSSPSSRTNDMQSLLSMTFSSNDDDFHNKKDMTVTTSDQQDDAGSTETKTSRDDISTATTLTVSDDIITKSNQRSPTNAGTKNSDATKKKSEKQQKRPQTGKRRSPNAFFVFCSDRRQILKQGKPNARNTDINRQLGDEWKALTQEERDCYD